ncbi:MAG: MGH1-like glycoside hydrolase domain-containing protein, partial [Janthinobacterium lividum]
RLSPAALDAAAPASAAATASSTQPFADFDAIFAARIAETNDFYAVLQAAMSDADARLVQRQALAGMIWSKQFYSFDMLRWMEGDPDMPPPPPERRSGRNSDWHHLSNHDIVSMPDKWEYPWYASWDTAFHAVVFAMIDPEFAKGQLLLLLDERYMHPNGQLPAYEWEFSDANPPVHAWAAWEVYEMDKTLTGQGDFEFLERILHKLLLNFAWWVNRKDAQGRNIFQGGFLGLDNIEIFDRSQPLPTGGRIDQADGTAWMAAYALNLMRIALELASTGRPYGDIAIKFFEHFLYIAEAAIQSGGASPNGPPTEPRGFGDEANSGLWDEQDQFFYDVLKLPDGSSIPLRVRSVVGLIPLFAIHVLDREMLRRVPHLTDRLNWFLEHRPKLAALVSRWTEPGEGDRALLSLLRRHRTESLCRRMLDESEFLSPFGVRSVSKRHEIEPYIYDHQGQHFGVRYVPGESDNHLFGGNSNWRGPVWLPINFLLVEALREGQRYYGDTFQIEYPTGSGKTLTLGEIGERLAERVKSLFLRDEHGTRASMCAYEELLSADRAHGDEPVLFHEYFHGDSGRGLGASHQTGWTGLVALLLQPQKADPACAAPQVPAAPRRPQAADASGAAS